MLAELIKGHEIATLMFPNQLVQVRINLYVILIQLLLEFLSRYTSQSVLLQSGAQLLLISIQALPRGTSHLYSLGSMEILVIWLHRGHISRVLFEISIVIECICDLAVLHLTYFLSADVVDEFRGWLNSHLCLYLLDKGVCVDLACVESFEHIIESSGCTVIKLSLNNLQICNYLA